MSSAHEAHHSRLMERFPEILLSCCLLDSIGRVGAEIGLDFDEVIAVDSPDISDFSFAESLLISERSSDNDLLT